MLCGYISYYAELILASYTQADSSSGMHDHMLYLNNNYEQNFNMIKLSMCIAELENNTPAVHSLCTLFILYYRVI